MTSVTALATAAETTIATNVPSTPVYPIYMATNTSSSARELVVDYYDVHITELSR